MSENLITCPLCGYVFDPAKHLACRSCPLQKGCQLLCCPVCGYQMVDLDQSVLVRTLDKLVNRIKNSSSDMAK